MKTNSRRHNKKKKSSTDAQFAEKKKTICNACLRHNRDLTCAVVALTLYTFRSFSFAFDIKSVFLCGATIYRRLFNVQETSHYQQCIYRALMVLIEYKWRPWQRQNLPGCCHSLRPSITFTFFSVAPFLFPFIINRKWREKNRLVAGKKKQNEQAKRSMNQRLNCSECLNANVTALGSLNWILLSNWYNIYIYQFMVLK